MLLVGRHLGLVVRGDVRDRRRGGLTHSQTEHRGRVPDGEATDDCGACVLVGHSYSVAFSSACGASVAAGVTSAVTASATTTGD